MRKQLIVATIIGLTLWAGQASADSFSFDNITANNLGNAAIGEAQLSMDVTWDGTFAVFKFSNSGPEASSITDIYFDDDVPMLLFADFNESGLGVDFSEGASPSNLPGGNTYSFTSDYAYDSDPPAQPNGVNPGEWLEIVFNLSNGYTFQNILDSLYDDTMRVGIHVQGFENGGSESFIADPGDPVPEPATMLLFGAGLAGLAGTRFRRKN